MSLPNRRLHPSSDFCTWLLAGCVSLSLGCSATRFRAADGAKSIASVGDQSLPTTVGASGSQVTTETAVPDPYRNPRATISGRVVDDQGRAISGAVVRLADGSSKAGRDVRTTTDPSGAFTLGGLRSGNGYLLVAEADFGDEQGVLTGRAEATTSDTGVQIRLGDAPSDAVPPRRSTAKTPRSRQVTDRVDGDLKPTASPSTANLEDIEPPAVDALEVVPAPGVGGRRKSVSKVDQDLADEPDSSSSWRRPGAAPDSKRTKIPAPTPVEPDADEPANLDPGAKSTRQATPESDDAEGDNPLPLSIPRQKPQASSGSAASRSGSVAQNQAKPRAKIQPDPEAGAPGELALGREAATSPADVQSTESAEVAPGLKSMPSLSSLDETSSAPETLALAGVPGLTESPPPDQLNLERPSLATSTNPAASAPGEVVSTSAAPSQAAPTTGPPPTGTDYNPFALVPAVPLEPLKSAAAAVPRADQSTVVQAVEPAASSTDSGVASEPEVAAASKPTKWGELVQAAPIAGAAALGVAASSPRASADPAKSTTTATATAASNRPGAFFMKRTKVAAATKPDAEAMSEFDTRANQLVDFQLPDLAGQPVRFRDLDADFVILDFWGTWCGQCVSSIPHLVELQKKYGPTKLKVVGIACEKTAVDKRKALVGAAVERLGINYPVLVASLDGTDPVQRDLQVRFYPTMVLLNRQGKVLFRAEGGTESNLFRLDRALAAATRPTQTARR